jgi:hypothetical protein
MKCAFCGADTQMYVSEIPLCIDCDHECSEGCIQEHLEVAGELTSSLEEHAKGTIILK